MVTLNMESRNPMGRVYAENRSKTQKPLGFKGLILLFCCNQDEFCSTVINLHAFLYVSELFSMKMVYQAIQN